LLNHQTDRETEQDTTETTTRHF